MKKISALKKSIKAAADSKQAVILQRFFKTGPGDYGAGDKFLGVKVPLVRRLVRDFYDLSLVECSSLLDSTIHEERQAALFIMIEQFHRGDDAVRTAVKNLYDTKMERVNNWDLVDASADRIFGEWFRLTGRDPLPTLRRLAGSKSLWRRRVAIMSTFTYIKHGSFDEALDIAARLLHDPHNLIQKAVGWMLREVGKRDRALEERFLVQHYRTMPRTALRYAIEKFLPERRRKYLAGKI